MKFKLEPYNIWELGQRQRQEDSIYPSFGECKESDRLFILCDGMGGHSAGDVASSTVCEAMGNYIKEHNPEDGAPFSDDDFRAALSAAYDALDTKDNGETKKMGCTLTFLKFHADGATIAHIGDSRVYHIRPGKSAQETEILFQTSDHSLVNDLVKIGELTPEEAKHSRQKNVITRAMQPNLERRPRADIKHIGDIRPGDYFMLCSDGILEQMEDNNIQFIFSEEAGEAKEKVEMIIRATADNRDNHTAFIIRIGEVTDVAPDEQNCIFGEQQSEGSAEKSEKADNAVNADNAGQGCNADKIADAERATLANNADKENNAGGASNTDNSEKEQAVISDGPKNRQTSPSGTPQRSTDGAKKTVHSGKVKSGDSGQKKGAGEKKTKPSEPSGAVDMLRRHIDMVIWIAIGVIIVTGAFLLYRHLDNRGGLKEVIKSIKTADEVKTKSPDMTIPGKDGSKNQNDKGKVGVNGNVDANANTNGGESANVDGNGSEVESPVKDSTNPEKQTEPAGESIATKVKNAINGEDSDTETSESSGVSGAEASASSAEVSETSEAGAKPSDAKSSDGETSVVEENAVKQ